MTQKVHQIPWDQILPGNNDRTIFDKEDLQDLADNIEKNGLIQPITVRPAPSSLSDAAEYEIVAGERRFRAIRSLGWETVPAIVKELSDEDASAIMLSENVSRSDLDPIDEANAYLHRIERLGWTVAECAKRAGVSDVRVQYRLKLLTLREDLQHLVRTDNLKLGYAQILASANLDPNRQSLAVAALRKNPKPTTGWFRRLVSEYATQQHQAKMFEEPLWVVQEVPASQLDFSSPPTPSTVTPDLKGDTPGDTILKLIEFWNTAALEWQKLGKNFKVQECQAASLALQNAYQNI